LRIVLIEPEIPQNTGNIARLASALGIELWLVGRLGFSMTDKYMKRAGMDYWDKVNIRHVPTLTEYYGMIGESTVFISTRGAKVYTQIKDAKEIVFGNESSGFPPVLYEKYSEKLYRIPMKKGVRSINLSSAVAAVAYHMAAKEGFYGLT
jgi:tRNA (cytidine/uridine-2'-O-)-methyltransferase